jgi:hypothetical protein
MKGFFITRVRNGRLILDEPVALPDGTLLELALVDHGHAPSTPRNAASLIEIWTRRSPRTRPAS